MRRSTQLLLLTVLLAAVAGACGRTDGLTAPRAWQASESETIPPTGGEATTQDDAPPPPPPADTTGRWGGGLGSGT